MQNLAVIFDLDGVLIDSISVSWQVYNTIYNRYGIQIEEREYSKYEGLPLRDQIELINSEYKLSIDASSFEKEVQASGNSYFNKIVTKDGVNEILEKLTSAGVPIGLGTSASRSFTLNQLNRMDLRKFFQAIVAYEDVPRHKPNPDVYKQVAKNLNVSPDICVVIEDSPNGVAAAKKAEMRCIAIKTKSVQETLLSKADLILNSLNDLEIKDIRRVLS
jgi:HAD superfamily hydrolase (TIGR01509 family)